MNLPVVLRHQAAEELLAACDYLKAQREGLTSETGTQLFSGPVGNQFVTAAYDQP